jgi:hypothetical protein
LITILQRDSGGSESYAQIRIGAAANQVILADHLSCVFFAMADHLSRMVTTTVIITTFFHYGKSHQCFVQHAQIRGV